MNAERFHRMKEHYSPRSSSRPPSAAYLDALPVADRDLRGEIEDLLRQSEATTGIDLEADAERPRSLSRAGRRRARRPRRRAR